MADSPAWEDDKTSAGIGTSELRLSASSGPADDVVGEFDGAALHKSLRKSGSNLTSYQHWVGLHGISPKAHAFRIIGTATCPAARASDIASFLFPTDGHA